MKRVRRTMDTKKQGKIRANSDRVRYQRTYLQRHQRLWNLSVCPAFLTCVAPSISMSSDVWLVLFSFSTRQWCRSPTCYLMSVHTQTRFRRFGWRCREKPVTGYIGETTAQEFSAFLLRNLRKQAYPVFARFGVATPFGSDPFSSYEWMQSRQYILLGPSLWESAVSLGEIEWRMTGNQSLQLTVLIFYSKHDRSYFS